MIQEGMTIKCAKCGGSVVFNPATGKMLCQSCGYEAEAGDANDMERGESLNLDPFSEGSSDETESSKIHFREESSLKDISLERESSLGGSSLSEGFLGDSPLNDPRLRDESLGDSLGRGFIDDRPIGADLFPEPSEDEEVSESEDKEKLSLSLKTEPEEDKEKSLDWLYKSNLAGQPPSAEKAEREFIKNFEKAYEQEHSYQELENFGEETVQLDRYICSSCGAILLLHGEQITKECGFCGNATITFDKVSDEKKPDKILPFKLSQEQALECIKNEYSDKPRQKYTSPLVQNINVTDIRGIYIPNWLYSGKVRKRMVFKLSDISDEKSKTYIKDATAEYNQVPINAALNLNDEITANLEPYDFSKLTDFNIDFLTGFYADKSDMTTAQGLRNAEKRFDTFMTKTLVDSFADDMGNDVSPKKSAATRATYMYCPTKNYESGNEYVLENERDINMTNTEYIFLPVYFVAVKDGNEVYTILVNGQTGKVTSNLNTNQSDIKPRSEKNTFFGMFGFIGGQKSHKDYNINQQMNYSNPDSYQNGETLWITK